MHQFRIKEFNIRKKQFRLFFAGLVGVTLGHLLSPKGLSASTIIFIILLLAALDFLNYYIRKQHVWVTLSNDGVIGQVHSGRKVHIEWHEEVTIEKFNQDEIHGIILKTAHNKNHQANHLFVPNEIAFSEEFSSTIAKLAPENHALRSLA